MNYTHRKFDHRTKNRMELRLLKQLWGEEMDMRNRKGKTRYDKETWTKAKTLQGMSEQVARTGW